MKRDLETELAALTDGLTFLRRVGSAKYQEEITELEGLLADLKKAPTRPPFWLHITILLVYAVCACGFMTIIVGHFIKITLMWHFIIGLFLGMIGAQLFDLYWYWNRKGRHQR